MRWMHKHGKNLQWYESLIDQGEEPPPAYYEMPTLYQDLFDTFKIFEVLNSTRQVGFQANPIQISEIVAYCELFGITDLEYKRILIERIQIMDKAFLGEEKKKKPKTKPVKPVGKAKRRK